MSASTILDLKDAHRRLAQYCCATPEAYSETDLCHFCMEHGSKYQSGGLLVVGRATNDWIGQFSKHDSESAQSALDEISPRMGASLLQEVFAKWKTSTEYNPNRSAFWRVHRNLVCSLVHDDPDTWFEHAAYSNLCKIAPTSGNPGDDLFFHQFELCLEILQLEILILQPKQVVFLTGYDWAGWFTARLLEPDTRQESLPFRPELDGCEFVQQAFTLDRTHYIVSRHPQGKPEESHIEEIMRVIRSATVSPASTL